MLLFLEGPDNSGKSTFQKQWMVFAKNWISLYIGRDNIPGIESYADFFLGYHMGIIQLAHQNQINIISHRSYVSDYVYAPFYGTVIYPDKFQYWLDHLPSDTLFVYFTISHEDYLQRSLQKKDTAPLHKKEDFELVCSRYQEFWRIFNIRAKVLELSGITSFEQQREQLFARIAWTQILCSGELL